MEEPLEALRVREGRAFSHLQGEGGRDRRRDGLAVLGAARSMILVRQ
jgi:hypothetical protein